jgi:ADP-ribose pyrophosphatase YjhB (NUDIX family)
MHTESGFFGLRAEGVMIHNGRVLLHQPETLDLWTFPGGGVHLHETFEEALIREWLEETGFEIEVKRLLYVIENFFVGEETHFPHKFRNKKIHGLSFCFLVEPTEIGVWMEDEFYGQEDIQYQGRDLRITFRWFNSQELKMINLVPICLKEALQNIPEHPIHIVNREI